MKSIQRSFVLLTLASALFLAVVLGFISVSSVMSKADADASIVMNLTCANEADSIDKLLAGIEDAVDLESAYMKERASKTSNTGEWLGEAEVLLASIADQTPGAVAYFFHPAAGEEGFFYARASDDGEYQPMEIPDLAGALPGVNTGVSGFDVGLDIDALKSGKAIWLEPFEIDENGTRVVCYLRPLVVDGRFRGSVGMGVDFQLIVDQVESIDSYEEGYGFLTDADGYVMYHPTIPYGTKLSEDAEASAVNAAIEAGTTTDDVVAYRYHGADKRMAFHLLKNNMRLVLAVDAREIYAERDYLAQALVVSTALAAVLVVIAATVGSRRMLRPLRRLTEAAEQVAAGDLSVQLPKADVREVSSLVAAYEVTVNEMREQMAVIDEMAHKDALTGFLNTGAYEETAAQLDAWIAAGKEVDFTLAMLDVNNLKPTNDTLGHDAGDMLLRRAVNMIKTAFAGAPASDGHGVRGLDIPALSFYRVGGDEFVVLVVGPSSVSVDELEAVGDDGVSIACGVAHYRPGEDKNTASVRVRADALMYEHKREHAASTR